MNKGGKRRKNEIEEVNKESERKIEDEEGRDRKSRKGTKREREEGQ